MRFLIRYHRPERPDTPLLDWIAAVPALLLAGAMAGHLIEAMVR